MSLPFTGPYLSEAVTFTNALLLDVDDAVDLVTPATLLLRRLSLAIDSEPTARDILLEY